jgi:uncharacterized 2Fe-2S/4Fe-4S cluster protein (DUF4445 family)
MRLKAAHLARWATHVSTPLESSFQDEFVAALNIPHARDSFPHVQEFLPQRNMVETRKKRSGIRQKNRSLR